MLLRRTLGAWIIALLLPFVASEGQIQSSLESGQESVLSSPPDENTTVRFFYQPTGEYFHFPLIFRAVGESDTRLNTAPMLEEGRTAYISSAEMRELTQRLARAGLKWKESQTVEALGSSKNLTRAGLGLDTMDVLVSSSKGSARATIAPKAICKTLKPLDPDLKTPRALWELQRFRLNYGCKVPGFKYDAYPDHY